MLKFCLAFLLLTASVHAQDISPKRAAIHSAPAYVKPSKPKPSKGSDVLVSITVAVTVAACVIALVLSER